MILTHPLWVRRLRPRHGWHVVHYLYVGLVMMLFVAQLKGEFPGADPSPVHGVAAPPCVPWPSGPFCSGVPCADAQTPMERG